MREKIEDHLKGRKIEYENQYGFTKEGRPEHCHFILQYLADRVYTGNTRKKTGLYFAFIDFKKAYDSVNRKRPIEVLIKYKVNSHIIDMIIQMYKGDSTKIQLGKMKSDIEVTSGIRQGCAISTLLFKMITFTIIEKLIEKAPELKIGSYKGNSLWLADDATIVASNTKDLQRILEVLKEEAGKNNLELNKEKTKILIIRGPQVEKIGEYEVTKEVKYLGIKLG